MWKLILLLAVTAPLRSHIEVAPGERVWVEARGAGRDVVLIPGLLGSAFGFRRLVPLLNEAGYRTTVVEPLGLGYSDRPPDSDYSLTAQADRIAAALDSLGVRRALVIGHAVGASIALRVALRRPDLVAGTLCIEGGAAESAATPGFRRALVLAPLVRLLGARRILRGRLEAGLRTASGDPGWITDEVVAGYAAPALEDVAETLRAYQAMGRAQEPQPLTPRLPEIRSPVLLLLGGAIRASRPSAAEVAVLRARLPAFVVDTVPGVGHFPHEEQPAAVAAALARLDRAAAAPTLPPVHP